MRWLLLLTSMVLAGCVRQPASTDKAPGQLQDNPPPVAAPSTQTNRTGANVTPSVKFKGKVAMANAAARHAILTFPIGQMPPLGQRLNVYRAGLKVGEVQLTGPQRDVNVAVDIVAGECLAGDEVRED